jgi:hypothetical protein
MDEYVATVLMEGENTPTELKSFGVTPEEIVDNMVLLPNVEYLYHITRLRDKEVWDFDTELDPLREIRKMITATGGEIGLQIKLEKEDEDNTPLH